MLGSEGQAVNAKKYRRYSDHLSWGKPLSARFSRAQSATHEALVDAFCFSGATVSTENSVQPMAGVIPPNEQQSSSGLRPCLNLVTEIFR
jgi:hypothetical protein